MKEKASFLVTGAATLLAACSSVPSPGSNTENGGLIQLEELRTRDGTSYFRMTNRSDNAVLYYHWFGQGAEPVPYCRYADETIRACSKIIYVDGDRLHIHERPIGPGRAVTFSAETKDAAALGVLLWLDGREQYVWHPMP